MDIQYSVKPAGSEIRKEKIKSRLFGLFITLFIMSALIIKMFVFVTMLPAPPPPGAARPGAAPPIAADDIPQIIMS